ncbi:hypothetical protein [Desulfovibrio ferrophilus]|uniref:Uncharacterized protein n=1 Tax=Desulfovibrio ferrophilus TaxID=241368 RepID=A0A2Z6AZI8_9BACT|nr:hypothetical protein [Desulfovibrio ferrophilus]BBD08662.1 hypothetical protein DFE_1936 [Desulfovibrio ferrophilus]
MWEALTVGMKMLALIVMFTFLALAFGAGIVKMQNKKHREREARGK